MTIIIRSLVRYDCQKSAAMAHYLHSVQDEIEAAGAVVSEHVLNIEYGLCSKYGILPEHAPVTIFERNGLEVGRIKGIAASEEILDVLAHAKAVR